MPRRRLGGRTPGLDGRRRTWSLAMPSRARSTRPSISWRNAARAEEAGFDFALVSDHFHPWIDRQGHSPFVWGVLGGIAARDRAHPHRNGRHVPDHAHPSCDHRPGSGDHRGDAAGPVLPRGRHGREPQRAHPRATGGRRTTASGDARGGRRVMRELWNGEITTTAARHYTVENARLYTVPDDPIDVMVAAGGAESRRARRSRSATASSGTSPERECSRRSTKAAERASRATGSSRCAGPSPRPRRDETALRDLAERRARGPARRRSCRFRSHFEAAAAMVTEERRGGVGRLRARRREACRRDRRSSSTPGTTTCTSTRSVRTGRVLPVRRAGASAAIREGPGRRVSSLERESP